MGKSLVKRETVRGELSSRWLAARGGLWVHWELVSLRSEGSSWFHCHQGEWVPHVILHGQEFYSSPAVKPNVALRGACVSCHEDSLNTTLVEGPSFQTTYPELSLLSCSSSCSCFTFSTLRGAVDEPSSASPLRGASSSVLPSLTSVFDGSGSALFRVTSGFSS